MAEILDLERLPLSSMTAFAEQMTGEEMMKRIAFCLEEANKQCPKSTISCEAFRRSSAKGCMVYLEIPAEYIALYVK